jgi:hypothetical protein
LEIGFAPVKSASRRFSEMEMEMLLRLPVAPTKSKGLFASRTTLYISIILFVILAAYAYRLRTDSIFSCQANWYSADRYLAYCGGASYGDYDHGAFLFDLEPKAQEFAKNADVFFLGNSRLQVAFSTTATADWFSAASARYYLLGFTYWENVIFAEELLRRLHPQARVYVINVDDFFERSESVIAKTILHDPEARNRYERKRLWQRVHEPVCRTFAPLCGNQYWVFRSRETGAYTGAFTMQTGRQRTMEPQWRRGVAPVSYDWVTSQNVVDSNTAIATNFLSHLAVEPECVILTMVPWGRTKIGNANAIAKTLGVNLVTPEVRASLQTTDGDHLDQPSAEGWSQAFYQVAGSRIRSCLEKGAAHQ